MLTRRRYLDDLNVQVLDARDLPAAREWQRSYVQSVARALQQHAWGVLGVWEPESSTSRVVWDLPVTATTPVTAKTTVTVTGFCVVRSTKPSKWNRNKGRQVHRARTA